MNSFSFNRFCKTFRWYFSMNFLSLMAWSGGYVVGVFLGELLFFALRVGDSQDHILENIMQFSVIFILIAMTVGTCTFLSDFNKKAKRETFLMLPASNLEKYLSAVLYVVVAWTVGVFLSYALGDTLRMVFRSLVYGDEWKSAVPMVINNMSFSLWSHPYSIELMWFDTMLVIVFVTMLVWIHSVYTFGGTLLRKYSYVVTSAFVILCFVALAKFINYYHLSLFRTSWNWDDGYAKLEFFKIGTLSYVLAVILPIFSVINYWFSYRIFKGYELITNKWFNYDFHKR